MQKNRGSHQCQAGTSTYSGTYIKCPGISFGKYRGKKQFKLQERGFVVQERGV
jgi:hypothetical protein